MLIASSYKEIIISDPPEDAGEHIASKSGFQIIEFWHSSSGKMDCDIDYRKWQERISNKRQ
jgi:hypothetical protein